MSVLVVGVGAVGGYVAASLAASGTPVAVVARPAHVERLAAEGITLHTPRGTHHVQLPAYPSLHAAQHARPAGYDLIITAIKSYDMPALLPELVAAFPKPALILTTQNGLGIEEQLIALYGSAPVVAGSVTVPVSRNEAGEFVVERVGGGIGLAPADAQRDLGRWHSALQAGGIETNQVASIASLKWSKCLVNIISNASSAILNRKPTAIYADRTLFGMERAMLHEALAVMAAQRVPVADLPGAPIRALMLGVRWLPPLLLQRVMRFVAGNSRGDKWPSFHIDLYSGRQQNEVLYHNVAIAERGRQAGVPTPVNRTLAETLLMLVRRELPLNYYADNPAALLEKIAQARRASRGGGA